MDFYELKPSVEKIEMSDEMESRIIRKCRAEYAAERSKQTMRKISYKKPVMAAIAVVLCLCLAIGAGAAVGGGMFKDIKDWRGAVTGTEYVQASEEISVSLEVENGCLYVSAVMVKPDVAPYRCFEQLGIAEYSISDKNGNVLLEGKTDMLALAEGEAEFVIVTDGLDEGEYVLSIDAFVGGSKADQPLKISGSWKAEFAV